jgi:hypothetical protein
MRLAVTDGTRECLLRRATALLASTARRSFWMRPVAAGRAPIRLAGCRVTTGSFPFQAGSFDAVVNLFTSFGFFSEEDDFPALTEFRRVLRPGRALVLEAIHRDRLMAIFREQDWEQLPDDAILLERRSFDSVNGICEVALRIGGKVKTR